MRALWRCALLSLLGQLAYLNLTCAASVEVPYVALAISAVSPTGSSETISVLQLANASGVTAALPAQTFAPGVGPCSVGWDGNTDGGAYLVPSGLSGTTLLRLSAATGAVDATITLSTPVLIATAAVGADGLLYAIGSPPAGSAYLELVSVNTTSGLVSPVSPVLTDNVQECAAAVDAASGILVFAYTGPLQLPIVGGMPTSASGSGGFSIVMNASVLAVAAMPAAVAGGSPRVLFIAEDSQGSIGGLQLLEPDAGTSRLLIAVEDIIVNVALGSLVYDAPSNTAAALAQVVHADGTPDVLVVFDLGARTYAVTVLKDSAVAAQGVWALAVAGRARR